MVAHRHALIVEESFMSRKQSLTSIGQPVPELPITDVDRAQHYRDALGFKIGWLYLGKIAAVSRGNVAIFFRKTTPPFEAAVHWVFAEDIDATYNELKSLGANMKLGSRKREWPSIYRPEDRGTMTVVDVLAASAGPERDMADRQLVSIRLDFLRRQSPNHHRPLTGIPDHLVFADAAVFIDRSGRLLSQWSLVPTSPVCVSGERNRVAE
jgi:hypothetical protein